MMIFYECGICDQYHPWEWDGDCRDDANRYSDPPDNAEIRSMEDRMGADSVETIVPDCRWDHEGAN